jgi:hypothetical protein
MCQIYTHPVSDQTDRNKSWGWGRRLKLDNFTLILSLFVSLSGIYRECEEKMKTKRKQSSLAPSRDVKQGLGIFHTHSYIHVGTCVRTDRSESMCSVA